MFRFRRKPATVEITVPYNPDYADIGYCRANLAADPSDPQLRLRLAAALHGDDLLEDARIEYEETIRLLSEGNNSDDPLRRLSLRVLANCHLGRVLERLGRISDARAAWQACVYASQQATNDDALLAQNGYYVEAQAKLGNLL